LGLDDEWGQKIIAEYVPVINKPDYYQPGFTTAQQELIRKVTRETAELFATRNA
jgi:hypothetical protein